MIRLIIILVILGVAAYIVEQITMIWWMKLIIRVVIGILVIMILMNAFGIVDVPVPQLR